MDREENPTYPRRFAFRALGKLLRLDRGETQENTSTQDPTPQEFATALTDEIKKRRYSRRGFLKLTTAALTETVLLFLIDHYLYHLPARYLYAFRTSDAFRQKVFQELREGELVEDWNQAVKSHEKAQEAKENTATPLEMEPTTHIQEPWMEACKGVETFRLRHKTIPTWQERYVVFLEPNPVHILPVHMDTVDAVTYPNFTKTVQNLGKELITLPGSQVQMGGGPITFLRKPNLYSAYVLPDGSMQEEFEKVGVYEGSRSPLRGAVIVTWEGNVIVCPPQEAVKYEVGKNCRAIESCPFVIEQASDLDVIDTLTQTTDNNYKGSVFSYQTVFNSALVTFYDKQNRPHTRIISRFQQVDVHNQITKGTNDATTLISLRDLYTLCEQYKQEKGFIRLVLQVPDPENESELKTSQVLTDEQMERLGENARQFFHPTMGALKQPVGFEDDIGLSRHRVLGDGLPFGYPITKTIVLASVAP